MPKILPRCDSSEVGLTELLIALHELGAEDDETRALIAKALGLGWRGVKEPPTAKKDAPTLGNVTSIAKGVVWTPELKVPEPSPSSETPENLPATILDPINHEDLTFEYLSNDPVLDSIEVLEQTDIEKHMKRPGYQPLLHDRWFRSLMSAMLATKKSSQEIDWAVLVRDLARGRPLEKLPFRPRPTMQRGVLLFLDHSRSMQPFWRDEEKLLLRLQGLLGNHNVQVWWLEVDQWSPDGPKLKPYSQFPSLFPERTPLLLVSDFGIGGDLSGSQADLEPWLPLIDLAQKDSSPVVALIPVPDSYWPEILRQRIPYSFVWDRETSITTVRRHRRRVS